MHAPLRGVRHFSADYAESGLVGSPARTRCIDANIWVRKPASWCTRRQPAERRVVVTDPEPVPAKFRIRFDVDKFVAGDSFAGQGNAITPDIVFGCTREARSREGRRGNDAAPRVAVDIARLHVDDGLGRRHHRFMSLLLDAATALSDAATAPDGDFETTVNAASAVMSESAFADADSMNGALRILLAGVRAEDAERAGIAAAVCGGLIEAGADASLATEHLVERFVELVKTSTTYVSRCSRHFEEHILSDEALCEICGPGEDEQDVMMPQVREAVSADFPEGESAWIGLDMFCHPVVSVLIREPELRRRIADDVGFVNAVGALSGLQPNAFFVWALLSLLDDEEVVVLHPETRRGWVVRVNGVADNYQLHMALAEQLINHGHLDGDEVEADVADVVYGHGPPRLDDLFAARWAMYNWTVLARDGSLPTGTYEAGEQHRIKEDSLPADIPQARWPARHRAWPRGAVSAVGALAALRAAQRERRVRADAGRGRLLRVGVDDSRRGQLTAVS